VKKGRGIHGARIAAIVTGAILTMGGIAGAQTTAPAVAPLTVGEWSVTPLVGTAFSGDVDSPTVVFGAAAGYNWSPRVSLEGEFNLLPSSENSGFVEVDTRVWNLTGNILYHFSGRDWVPYGAFGLGFGHGSADVKSTTVNSLINTSSTEFVVNFGGGVERAIRDGIRFRGDLRYFFGGDLVADYWRLGLGVSFDVGRGR
jgi:hypothetical protein